MAIGTAAAIGLGLAGLGGVAGAVSNMSAAQRAQLLQEKGVQEWLKVNIPDPAQQRLALDKFVSAGELTPQLEEAVKPLDTELAKVQGDPRLKESRMRALAALEQQGMGGEQVQDAAARQQAMIDSGAANRGRQQAIVGDLASRGQLGGGLELAARMDAAQAEGDRLASNSLGLEADRRNRALQALSGAGDLAGDIQSQDYEMASNAARARDAINLFNTQNLQNVSNRNVGRLNDAQNQNLANKQGIMDRNVGLNNFQQQYNKELAQQKFQNEAAVAAGKSGQFANQASTALNAGQNAAKMWGGVASGLGTAAYGLGQGQGSQQKPDAYNFSSMEDELEKFGSIV